MRGRGGHGHNDILSFELFLNGFNVVTDCGAYLYTASREWRNRFRSTAFHNTRAGRRRRAESFLGAGCALAAALRRAAGRARSLHARRSASTVFAAAIAATRGWLARSSHTRGFVRRHTTARACSFAIGSTATGSHALVWRFHLDPGGRRRIDRRVDVRLSSATAGTVWLLPDDTAARSDAVTRGRLGVAELRRQGPDHGARLDRPLVRRCPIDGVVSVCRDAAARRRTRRQSRSRVALSVLKWL